MAKKEFKCGQKFADLDTLEKMSHEECKHILAHLSKGIAHPARIQIVNILANKPDSDRCICGDIVNALPLAQSSVSQPPAGRPARVPPAGIRSRGTRP